MTDFHATEKLIGGSIVVGMAGLLNWTASQSGEPGLVGIALIVAMVAGGLWAGSGLFHLIVGPRSSEDAPMGASPAEPG